MNQALGLLETKGLIGAIEAADAMAKAADVTIISKEKSTAALVTIKIVGDTSAVRAALDAGAIAAERIGQLISVHLIPSPDDQIDFLITNTEKIAVNPSGNSEIIEDTALITEIDEVEDIPEDSSTEEEPVQENFEVETTPDEVVAAEPEEVVEDESIEQGVVETADDEYQTTPNLPEAESNKALAIEEDSEEVEEDSEDEKKNLDDFTSESGNMFENFTEKEDDPNEGETPVAKIEVPIQESKKSDEPEDLFGSDEDSEEKEEFVIDGANIPSLEELENLSVPELRKLARSVENFPIKGREISKANKQILLSYFKML